MTTEEFIVNLTARGFAVADMDNFIYGMLLNYCKAHDRLERIRRGEPVPDAEKQYRELKALEPYIEEQYALGKIKQEKYDSYKKSLAEWEAD